MTEEVVRRAVRSLLTEPERPLYHGHEGVRDWFDAVFGVFPGAGSGVQADKITFFGFFRTEADALKAVT
jgi:hypothetical protein